MLATARHSKLKWNLGCPSADEAPIYDFLWTVHACQNCTIMPSKFSPKYGLQTFSVFQQNSRGESPQIRETRSSV